MCPEYGEGYVSSDRLTCERIDGTTYGIAARLACYYKPPKGK